MPETVAPFIAGTLGLIGLFLVIWIIKLQASKSRYEQEIALKNQELQYQIKQISQLETEEKRQRSIADEAARSLQDMTIKLSAAEARLINLDKIEQMLTEKNQQLNLLACQVTELETRLQEEQKAVAEKIALLNEARESMTSSFKALSADALQASSQSFLDLAKTTLEQYQLGAKADLDGRQQSISNLVGPLQEALQKVENGVRELEKERHGAYAQLRTQIDILTTTHTGLQKETANLVKALRLPQVRGRWGEIQLQRVVELAGMTRHCDFVEQETLAGGRLRPDMIINLPGERRVPVDAKAPLTAYLNAAEAVDEREKAAYMQDHARQIRTHINNLAAKSYWESMGSAPEFVVLFLPGEVFFAAALEQDPGLIEYGVEQKVIIATPTTLIALLKGVSYGWRQEQLAQNAREICEVGKTLYERVRVLGNHFADLGRSLDKSIEVYNRTIGSLERNVLPSARRFKELGAASDNDIVVLEPIEKNARHLQAPEIITVTTEEKED